VDEYREKWQGHGKKICQISLPQALVCFLEGKDFEDVIRNCISIGGDSDTIAAIAGGIAEAYYGVPEEMQKQVRKYVSPILLNIYDAFCSWLQNRETGK
jgi:ADP-ribosylglycohydrolase